MSTSDKICNASKSNDDDDVREVIGRLHISNIVYVLIVARRAVTLTTYATNARLQLIAMLYVKRYTKRSIRKIVRNMSD